MKLTNYLRNAFVKAVANDLPDVKAPCMDDVQAALYKAMSPKVKAVYTNPETRRALKTQYYAPKDSGWNERGSVFVGDASLDDVLTEYHAACNARDNAISKVKILAASCSTLKQLQDAAPDLVKYMPSEKTGATPLPPAVVGVLDSLKAAGFPKEG